MSKRFIKYCLGVYYRGYLRKKMREDEAEFQRMIQSRRR